MLRADWMHTSSDERVFNYTSVWFLCIFDVGHCIGCKYSEFWLLLFSAFPSLVCAGANVENNIKK